MAQNLMQMQEELGRIVARDDYLDRPELVAAATQLRQDIARQSGKQFIVLFRRFQR